MTKVRLASVSEVPPGGMVERTVGEKVFLVANVSGSFRVVDGLCSHRGGRLAKGKLSGGVIRCPLHGSEFDLATGKVVHQPRIPLIGKATDIRAYVAYVEDGEVYIDL
ncbi:MAG: Rieske 2Fe-2S domain-containing protein [Methanomassiliicoccales archaeon]|nr:MAG: Rieske 2Fe-2S domain-containing protein [Methanomassiliicoccales archaeon]